MRLFLTHEREVRAFIRSLIRDAHVRDDLFQEVALVCWRSFDRYEVGRSFGAWAKGIAANKVMQRRSRLLRQPMALSPQAVEAILAAFNRTERHAPDRLDALRECVEKLPGKSRQLLAHRYERSLKPDEIAELLRGTREAVYKALARIRTKLEDCIRRRLASESRGA